MGVYNGWVIQQGADWDQIVYWRRSDGSAIPIQGTVRFQMGTDYGLTPVQSTLYLQSTISGEVLVTGPSGKIEIIASSTKTKNINPGYYVYELEIVNGSNVTRLMEGNIYVSPQVVKD